MIYFPSKIWLDSIGIIWTGNVFAIHNFFVNWHNIVITWLVARMKTITLKRSIAYGTWNAIGCWFLLRLFGDWRYTSSTFNPLGKIIFSFFGLSKYTLQNENWLGKTYKTERKSTKKPDLGICAVFSSYRTPNFFQYYQLTVNENSNSNYFTSALGMFCMMSSSSYKKLSCFPIPCCLLF